MEGFAIPFLLFVGSLLILQAAANVQLSAAMVSPFGASTLQLAIGAAMLLALASLAGSLGAFGLLDQVEPWHLVGGLGSAIYITAGILLFPRLGALVAVGLFISGQMLASLLLDSFGWLGVARDVHETAALSGAAAVVVGAWLIVRAQAGAGALEVAARERAGWGVSGPRGRRGPADPGGDQRAAQRRPRRLRLRSARSPSWSRPQQWHSPSARPLPPAGRARGSSRFAACRGGGGLAASAARPM
jgi:uncharacterized membrane protein YdcZ (DUF606 family)